MNIRTILCIVVCHTTAILHAQTKIIYFISTPRSLSTVFTRMMQARNDCTIFNEPSQWAFNALYAPNLKDHYNKQAAQTFAQVKEQLYQESSTAHNTIFVKEMACVAREFIPYDLEFLANPNVYFVLMARSPHAVSLSYYNKAQKIPTIFSRRVGSKALYELLETLNATAHNKPLILLAEDLYENPEQIIRSFCEHVGLPFDPKALNWEALGDDFNGVQEWHEIKQQEFTLKWHDRAIASTGFGKPAIYALDEQGKPTFQEVENLEHRAECIKAYEENLPYYQLLVHYSRNQ